MLSRGRIAANADCRRFVAGDLTAGLTRGKNAFYGEALNFDLMDAPTHEPVLSAPPCANISLEKKRWFKDEVHTHDAKLKTYLRSSFPSVDVDDVVQESYLRVWLANLARPVASARAFLFTVARHLALDSLRHRKKSPIIGVPDLTVLGVIDESRDAAEAAATSDEIALLAEAIDSLPARCREIIILRKIQHISQRDVAQRLGISEGTVEEQVYRGIRRLEAFFVRHSVIKPWKNGK
jgi:RNA polymerase sigma-70 factor (ECF subfamily)